MIDNIALFFVYIAIYVGLFIIFFYLITFFENINSMRDRRFSKSYFVSIIVPAYNEGKRIGKCIRSIMKSDYDLDKLEVIVVDDGSNDNTSEIAKQFDSKIVKVFRKANAGKAAALNYGIKKCKGDIICCIDADTYFSPNVIKRAVVNFGDEEVGVVVPTLKPYKPKGLIERIQLVEYTISSFSRKILSFHDSLAAAPACSFFRREIFEKYGGFDEGNITEDFEMALKAQSNNYRLVHLVDAVAYTDVPNTFKGLARQRIRWCYGTYYNVRKYKHLLNTKYGDFGVLFFPMIIVSIILSLSLAGLIVLNLFERAYNFFEVWSLIDYNFSFNFSLMPFIQHIFTFNFVLGFSIIFLGVVVLLLARHYTRENKEMDKANKSNFSVFDYAVYTFFYSVFLIGFWAISLAYFVLGRKPKW